MFYLTGEPNRSWNLKLIALAQLRFVRARDPRVERADEQANFRGFHDMMILKTFRYLL